MLENDPKCVKNALLNACKIWRPHASLTSRSPLERASGEKIKTYDSRMFAM